jgi:hypothetical protein
MSFIKVAHIDILGYQKQKAWHKSARKEASLFMEEGLINVENALDTVADTYKISRDPSDYLLVPARAVSADRFNANRDGFAEDELLRFDPQLGMRVYQTFQLKPHFVNHASDNPKVARGCVLDVHFNNINKADDLVKRAIYTDSGKEASTDNFVELLIGVDMTKDPSLAEAYKNGSVDKFSMGADVASTVCGVCGKEAFTERQFCPCVKNKFSGRLYTLPDGRQLEAGEWCKGTKYAEISVVDDPADKTADIQEGLLEVRSKLSASSKLSQKELTRFVEFTIRHASAMPESLIAIIDDYLKTQ